MGNKNNIRLNSVQKGNLINTKSITNRIKTGTNINFFYDILTFPEEEKIIVSTPKELLIFETISFKLVQRLEIKNLKILQNLSKNKTYLNSPKDHIYYFYASKEGSCTSIILLTINFNDFTIDTKEIIRKHMPKYYFLNFFVLSSDLIVLAFNKGTLMIFDDRNILIDDDEENDDKNIEEKKYPIEKEVQIFKYSHEAKLNEQQEACGFFEISDTCFIGITSMGGLRFYDLIESKGQFVVNKYMEGYWANPHSKNSIILLGNKLICAYKDITIIDANKRLITEQIKCVNINVGILNLQNETILLVSDYVINNNTKNMKRIILLSQYIITEEISDENGEKYYNQYNFSSGDLEGLSNAKALYLISEKKIPQTECNIITNCIEYMNKIITFSSQEINIIQ
jgi:hypothetical protein